MDRLNDKHQFLQNFYKIQVQSCRESQHCAAWPVVSAGAAGVDPLSDRTPVMQQQSNLGKIDTLTHLLPPESEQPAKLSYSSYSTLRRERMKRSRDLFASSRSFYHICSHVGYKVKVNFNLFCFHTKVLTPKQYTEWRKMRTNMYGNAIIKSIIL